MYTRLPVWERTKDVRRVVGEHELGPVSGSTRTEEDIHVRADRFLCRYFIVTFATCRMDETPTRATHSHTHITRTYPHSDTKKSLNRVPHYATIGLPDEWRGDYLMANKKNQKVSLRECVFILISFRRFFFTWTNTDSFKASRSNSTFLFDLVSKRVLNTTVSWSSQNCQLFRNRTKKS